MSKSIKSHPEVLLADQPRVFLRAATSARVIGFSATVLGGIVLYLASAIPKTLEPQYQQAQLAQHLFFASMFLIPGILYLVLSMFILRKRRWAIWSAYALAMLDMVFLGILFVSSWPTEARVIMCSISGAFVISIATLSTFLRRCLEAHGRFAN